MKTTMSVQIEVIRGPAAGQQARVSAETPVLVGRAADTGLCIPNDPTVSRHHCQINLVPPDCHLTSLSGNGTVVNGQDVTTLILRDGDEIRIGEDSVLKVRIRDEFLPESEPALTAPLPADLKSPEFRAQICASGMSRFSGCHELPGAWEIVRGLAEKQSIHAIADFNRIGMAPPPNLTRGAALYDWLPLEAPLAASPLLLYAGGPEFEPIFHQGWGKDALVILCGELDPSSMIEHLRKALRFNGQGKPMAHPAGLLGICWPSILAQLLAHRSPEFTGNLLAGINAVVLEDPESQSGWQVFASTAFSAVLEQMGLGLDPSTAPGGKRGKPRK